MHDLQHEHKHPHEHQHEHDSCCAHGHQHEQNDCCCGQEHEHEHHKHPDAFLSEGVKLTCLVENLGCANCAAKMENRISQLPGVNAATLTFATKQLRVSVTPEAAKNESLLIAEFQKICSSIESGVVVQKQHPLQKGKKLLQEDKKNRHKLNEHQIDLISIKKGT